MFYCNSGVTSGEVAEILMSKGFVEDYERVLNFLESDKEYNFDLVK